VRSTPAECQHRLAPQVRAESFPLNIFFVNEMPKIKSIGQKSLKMHLSGTCLHQIPLHWKTSCFRERSGGVEQGLGAHFFACIALQASAALL
jgi:hypothetical protein